MSANACSCSCGCSPCACSSGSFGCVSDLCVPRPCFFQGQLVTADDLNAAVTYFRTREAMLARFVGGWGILGGLRVDKAPGVDSKQLLSGPVAALSPNPQLLAGTTIQIAPGAAIDAKGRALTLCSPRILDIAQLMAEAPSAPISHPCSDWFAPYQGICSDLAATDLTATEYWLIAEYVETPSRPVPQLSGGGACDPAPTCDFSRRIEGVRFRLVTSLPPFYLVTGCLDPITPGSGVIPSGSGDPEIVTNGLAGVVSSPQMDCFTTTYTYFESWTQMVTDTCCSQPAVVLARLLVTSSPGSLGEGLPSDAPLYVFLFDGYPFRRIIASAARLTIAAALGACPPPVA